jgi:hypothetical protein
MPDKANAFSKTPRNAKTFQLGWRAGQGILIFGQGSQPNQKGL